MLGTYVNATEKVLLKCPENHEFTIKPGHFKDGVGCAACAKWGFNPMRPVYLYLFKLENRIGTALGFGITNDIDDRVRQHKNVFKKTRTEWEYLGYYYFENGKEGMEIEAYLKKHKHKIDMKIDGFRKEAIKWEYSAKIISGERFRNIPKNTQLALF